MKKWKKIIINKTNKITKVNKNKDFKDFCEEDAENYNIQEGYSSNEHYKKKDIFLQFYLKGRYLVLHSYLIKNIDPKSKTLSLASGRGINELCLISNKFDITCSDFQIPPSYGDSKKLFGNFNYKKINILENITNEKFDTIFSLSAFYLFSDDEIKKILTNINESLTENGILILEFPGSGDNFISFLFNEIYLTFESYLIYYLSKIFNKKIGLKLDNNFGYRRINSEVIKLATQSGFKLLEVNEYDYLNELKRSFLIRNIIKYLPFSKLFFIFIGKKLPYIRMFKFKKVL